MNWRHILTAVAVAAVAATAAPAQTDAIRFVADGDEETAPWSAIPDRFGLQGTVVDGTGAAVAGALVEADIEGLSAETDAAGHFVFAGTVSRLDRITFRHPDHAETRRQAWTLYSGDRGEAIVRLAAYTEIFEIGPGGGIYRSENLVLEVPRGAVFEAATVRIALPPLDLAYDDSPHVQDERLAAVAFDPAGPAFAAPLRLMLPLAVAGTVSGPQRVLAPDPESGRFEPDPEAFAEVDAGNAILTVSGPGQYVIANPARGVTRSRMWRSFDLNGDGGLTTEDAELVVILSGGDQSAVWPQISAVEARVTAAGAAALSPEQVAAITARYGFARPPGTSGTARAALEAGEMDTRCVYFLRWHDTWRLRAWRAEEPGRRELRALAEAFAAAGGGVGEWRYFRPRGASSLSLGRALYDGDRIAVHRGEEGYRVYRQLGDYEVREPTGAEPRDCAIGDLQARAAAAPIEDFSFFGGDEPLDQATFSATGEGYQSVRYGGWGILPDTRPERHGGLECGVPASGEVRVAPGMAAIPEHVLALMASRDEAISAALSADIPGAGGAGFADEIDTRAAARDHGARFLSHAGTTALWTVGGDHADHASDHAVYKLHLMITARLWEPIAADQVPRGLRAALVSGFRWSRGRAFARAGAGVYMATEGGDWYLSGEPAAAAKEIGFLLLRVGQRGCDGGVLPFADIGAEDIPGTAVLAPDRRHPDRQAVEIPEGAVNAYFSAIVGVTAVNPAYLGALDRIVVVARDGTEIPEAETAVEVDESDDAVTVTVAATSAARSLLLFGADGVVRLVAGGGGKGGLDGFLGLRDERIDIRDGRLGETVSLPPGLADPGAAPAAHRVTIGRQRARVVAVRAAEMAIAADDLRPPEGAATEVAVTGPSGARVAVEMPAWGYRILVQPVTNTRLWVPVRVQITGLGARERVLLRFTPDDTQSIEPAEVRITGAQARLPLPVAELKSSRIGAPKIKATVLRER